MDFWDFPGIWDFLEFRQKRLEWPQSTFVDWECVQYASLWCLEGSWVDFCWFETTFFWPTKIPKAQPPFFHFRSGLVRRNLSGVWLRSEVAWMIKLGSFLPKCSLTSTYHSPFEFWMSINFWKKLEKVRSTISTLWNWPKSGFSQGGSEASGTSPDNICWLGVCLICFPLMFGGVLSWFLLIWDNFFLANKNSKGPTPFFSLSVRTC